MEEDGGDPHIPALGTLGCLHLLKALCPSWGTLMLTPALREVVISLCMAPLCVAGRFGAVSVILADLWVASGG